jgi:hypothetical protein
MSKLRYNIMNSKETRDEWEATAAAIDVAVRNAIAKRKNPKFNSKDHLALVDAVKKIAGSFFTVRENIFDQARLNKGRPFTAVKIFRTQWPVVSKKVADARYYDPLEQLGGNLELWVSRNFSSHIIRVYL